MDKNVSSSNYTKESDLFQRTKGDSQQKLMCTCAGALSVCHSWEEADTAFSWQSECNSSKKYLCTQPLIPVSVLWGPGLSLMPWEPLHLSLVQWGSDSSTLPSSAFDVHLNSRSRGWRSKVLGGKIMSQKAACLWGGLERGCVLRRLGERLGERLGTWWFDSHIHGEMITMLKLIHTSITSYSYLDCGKNFTSYSFFFFFNLLVQLIPDVKLVSGVQQSDSVIHICTLF